MTANKIVWCLGNTILLISFLLSFAIPYLQVRAVKFTALGKEKGGNHQEENRC